MAGNDDHAPLTSDEDLEFRARLFSWMFRSLILVLLILLLDPAERMRALKI